MTFIQISSGGVSAWFVGVSLSALRASRIAFIDFVELSEERFRAGSAWSLLHECVWGLSHQIPAGSGRGVTVSPAPLHNRPLPATQARIQNQSHKGFSSDPPCFRDLFHSQAFLLALTTSS